MGLHRLAIPALVLLWSGLASAQVEVNLTAYQVRTGADQQERLITAESVAPGDVIEYQAVYSNPDPDAVQGVQATVPIPIGVEFIPDSAAPRQLKASLDGKTFEPVPLKRKKRLADGKVIEENVPYAEYRYVQWLISRLGKGEESTVKVRVKVAE